MVNVDRRHRSPNPNLLRKAANAARGILALSLLTSCGVNASLSYPTARPNIREDDNNRIALRDRQIIALSFFQGDPCTVFSPAELKRLELYRQGYTEVVWKIGECGVEPVYVKRIPGERYGITPEGDRVLLADENEPPIICNQEDAGLRTIQVYHNVQTGRTEVSDSECPPDSNGTLLSPREDETFVALTPEEQAFFEQDYQAKTRAQALIGKTLSSENISAIAVMYAGSTTVQALEVSGMSTSQILQKIDELKASGVAVLGGVTTIGSATAVVAIMAGGSYAGVVRQGAEGDIILAIIDPISGKPVGLYGHNTITGVDTVISIADDTRMIVDATGRTILVNASALEGEVTNIGPQGNPDASQIEPTPKLPEQQPDNKQKEKDEALLPHLSERQQQHDSIINGDRFMKNEFVEAYRLVRTTRNETNAEVIKQAIPLRGFSDIQLTKAIFDAETNQLLIGSWNASHEQIVAAYEGSGGIQNYNFGYSSRYFSGILYTVGKQQRPVFILDNDIGLNFNRVYALQQKEFDLMSPRGEWFVLRLDPLSYIRMPSALYGSLR